MERRELWRQRVAQQVKSGQSIRVFCHQKSLSEPAFYAWRKRLRSETKAVRFALAETKSAGTAAPIEVMLANGDRLRIPCEADPNSPPLTPFASLTADFATLNAQLRQANIAELRIDR